MKIPSIILITILILSTNPVVAIFEGSSNADIFIKVYKQHEDFGRVALWHEAAAACYSLISIPLNDISLEYYKRHGNEKWVERTVKERVEILERQKYHVNSAKTAWKKSKTDESVLKIEREKIAKFKRTWLPHYPEKFYDYGIYATYFKEQQERAEQEKDFRKVLNFEADAAEMVAAQYDLIPIKNGLKKYEIIRDAYLQHAALLRTLAKRTHTKLPAEISIGKDIRQKQLFPNVPTIQKTDEILRIAKTDPRIQRQLRDLRGVREYAWFQGFAWTVSFYNHSWGNIAIVIVEDKTGKILDVLKGEYLNEKVNPTD